MLNDCGLACGVGRADTEQSADAVFNINQTRVPISTHREPKILPIKSLGLEGSNLILYGSASHNEDPIRRRQVLAPMTALMFVPHFSFPASIRESMEKPMS